MSKPLLLNRFLKVILNRCMKRKILIFLLIFFTLNAIFSQQNSQKKSPQKNNFFNLLNLKKASIYSNIELSGGYNSDSIMNCPVAKLKIDIAEGIFSNFSIQSSASVTISRSSDEIYCVGLSIPDISFGYYFSKFLVYIGGSFYQCWYFLHESSTYEDFLISTHCYGYTLHGGLSVSLNDYISFFADYTFAPHNWIQTTGHSDIDWVYSNQIGAGICLSIPWSIN